MAESRLVESDIWLPYRQYGVQVLSIGMDVDVPGVQQWVYENNLTYPVLADQDSLVTLSYDSFGPIQYPQPWHPWAVIVDGDDTLRLSEDIYIPPVPPETVGSLNMAVIVPMLESLWDPMIVADPEGLEFGPVYINSTVELDVIIKNAGSYFLEVTGIQLVSGTPEFDLGVLSLPEPIYAVGDSLTVHVSFTPTAAVPYSDILQITYNDGTDETLDIPISGEGSTTGIEPLTHQPQKFEVSCYPNPFNAEMTILVNLQYTQNVSIALYDIRGVKEKDVWMGEMSAGPHELRWNAQDAPSGIYLLKAEGEDWSQVEKVVLVR